MSARNKIARLGANNISDGSIGTYTIALCAKMLNKPVYVMCESFKFVRMYPLNQEDLRDEFKYHASTLRKSKDLSGSSTCGLHQSIFDYITFYGSWHIDTVSCQ